MVMRLPRWRWLTPPTLGFKNALQKPTADVTDTTSMFFYRFFLPPLDSRFQIVVAQPNMVLSQQTINQWKAYLFSFQVMYKSSNKIKN